MLSMNLFWFAISGRKSKIFAILFRTCIQLLNCRSFDVWRDVLATILTGPGVVLLVVVDLLELEDQVGGIGAVYALVPLGASIKRWPEDVLLVNVGLLDFADQLGHFDAVHPLALLI